MTEEKPKCSQCGRPKWDGGHAMTTSECHTQGGDACELAAQLAEARAALSQAQQRIAELEAESRIACPPHNYLHGRCTKCFMRAVDDPRRAVAQREEPDWEACSDAMALETEAATEEQRPSIATSPIPQVAQASAEPSLSELLIEYERVHTAVNALIPDGDVKELATRGRHVTVQLLRRLVDAAEQHDHRVAAMVAEIARAVRFDPKKSTDVLIAEAAEEMAKRYDLESLRGTS